MGFATIGKQLGASLPHDHVVRRAVRFVRGRRLRTALRVYVDAMADDNPLNGFRVSLVGDCPADPTELFTHYDAFAYWEAEKLAAIGSGLEILDIGNKKATNAILSVQHNVTSIVLADCKDEVSRVRYLVHDVSNILPLPARFFDVFTSSASLHLVGLGRYGDRLNPNALPDLIKELDRVMRPQSHLLFSILVGDKDHLYFNNGWVFTLETLKRLFGKWTLADYLIDNASMPGARYTKRFSKDVHELNSMAEGEYRVAFFHFIRPRHAA